MDEIWTPVQNITDVPQHVSEPKRSCTAEILAVFWGSAAVFLLLVGAAVIMFRNGMFSSAGKKKKRGLDTLFELEDTPAPKQPPACQEWRLSSYAEVMSADTARHYRRISRSMGSINFRTFNSTMKGSTLYNTTRSNVNTQAAVDITISVVPPDLKVNKQSYWLGTETDFHDVYELLPEVKATPSRYQDGHRLDIAPEPDEEDATSEEPQGAAGMLAQRSPRHVPSKFLYISPVYRERNTESNLKEITVLNRIP